jgi:hypothetical protein
MVWVFQKHPQSLNQFGVVRSGLNNKLSIRPRLLRPDTGIIVASVTHNESVPTNMPDVRIAHGRVNLHGLRISLRRYRPW